MNLTEYEKEQYLTRVFGIDEYLKSVYKEVFRNIPSEVPDNIRVGASIWATHRAVGFPTLADELNGEFDDDILEDIKKYGTDVLEKLNLEENAQQDSLEYCMMYHENRNISQGSDYLTIVSELKTKFVENEDSDVGDNIEKYEEREKAALYTYIAMSISNWEGDNNKANLKNICSDFGVDTDRVSEMYVNEFHKKDWKLKNNAIDNNTGIYQEIEKIIENNKFNEKEKDAILYRCLMIDWSDEQWGLYDNQAIACVIVMQVLNYNYESISLLKPKKIVSNVSELLEF